MADLGNGICTACCRPFAGAVSGLTPGSLAELKATNAYGFMHLCRFEDCEVWVADGGDHRCVLHSSDEYAVQMRETFLNATRTQHE